MYVKAPAKINLTLDVLGRRSDGFHEVEMVMTTVDLADRLHLESDPRGRIRVRSIDRFVPEDERNLAYQAAALLRRELGVRCGATIAIEKNIPIAAGLAGGSSDAAAALKGLNHLWDLGLTLDELAALGAQIGSDVPFCVYGGTALATGRGECIRPLEPPPACWAVLAKPPVGVSTATVYGKVDLARIEHPDTARMLAALEGGEYSALCRSVGNALEPITRELHPEVAMLKEQMVRFGADAALMSGSGPTVFGLAQHEQKAQRIYNGLRGFCEQVFAVRVIGGSAPLA